MLKEVQYDKIFSPKTIANLKGKSGESLKKLWGNKSLRQAIMNNAQLLSKIVEIEKPYRKQLSQLAISIVKQAYPVISYSDIQIIAEIVDPGNINLDMGDEPIEGGDDMPETIKRRIINGITQGASVRGAYTFLLFQDNLDKISPNLLNDYKELLNLTFGVFDNDEAVAMMLAMLANNQKMEGGSSEAEYSEEEGLVIKAKALCFPYLVHEIVKGLYEIVSLQGFGPDKEKNKQVVQHVDRLSNEPDDTRMGKFIYDAINDLYVNSDYDDPRIREFLFTEIYKLDDEDFMSFIENAINGELSKDQVWWVKGKMKDISRDLGKDDTGLEDLD